VNCDVVATGEVPGVSAGGGRGRFSRAAARTRSPSARRAAASPTWQPAPSPVRVPAIFRVTIRFPQPCTPWAPQSVTSTRITPSAARTATVTISPAAPEPLCRARCCRTAHQQRGVIPGRMPRAEHPDCERPGNPGPLRPPGHCHALPAPPPWPSAHPPFPRPPQGTIRPPGRTHRCTPDSAARVKPGNARQRGPSVAVRGRADGAHRPSWRHGRRPLCVRGHRNASTHGDTPRYTT
jgi:hypothetical protein